LKNTADRVYQLLSERTEIADLKEYGVSQIRTTETPLEIGDFDEELRQPLLLKAQDLLESGTAEANEIPDPRVIEPVELSDGFVVLRIIQVYPGRQETFEEVRQEVEARLLEWKQREVAIRQAEKLLKEFSFRSDL